MKKSHILLLFCAAAAHAAAQTDTLALQEVVVTGTRSAADVRHLPMTVSVIGRDALTREHRASVLPTVSELVPSLFVSSRSVMGYGVSGGAAGGINLRGVSGGGGQMLVLIDGHPQYSGVYGHPISDSYQTLMAERVEVLRGPASVLYGSNAMGGVLNIVTRSLRENGAKTTIDLSGGSYGTLQAEASTQVRHGRLAATAAARYGRSDNHRPRMGFEQYGGYAKVAYDIDDRWSAYVDADVTHFAASHPGTTDSPLYGADQWITRGMVSAALEHHTDRTSGQLSLYTNFGRHKIDDGTASPAAPTQRFFRSKDALTGVSWYHSTRLFTGNRLTVGADYQHIYGRAYYTDKQSGALIDTPNKQSGRSYRNEVAGYVDFRQDLLSWLTIDAGLRLDHHSVTGTELVPQAGIVVRPTATGELKAMAAKGFRNPTMRELYLYPPSNDELAPERLWSYELSWRQRTGPLSYGANLYYITGDNMIQTLPVNGTPRNVNTGKIENCGVELEASYRLDSRLTLSTNHSLLHMEEKVVGAPTYKGFVGADLRCHRWAVVVGLQYVSGLYTSVGTREQKEDFLLLNTTLSYALTPGVSLWARGENLLAQCYEINLGYPMPRATVMGGVNISF